MIKPLSILILMVCTFTDCFGQSPDIYVYQIKASNGGLARFTQTGFKMAGYKGLLTCLHGLVGNSAITAVNQKSNKTYSHLKIIQVDFERDVALVSNDELAAEPAKSGLQEATNFNIADQQGFISYGHPFGISLVARDDIRIAPNGTVKLLDRIPLKERDIYLKRHSPDPSITVIEMRYNFGNGESGAPILNRLYQVVGINDGGFPSQNISWAIPVNLLQMTTNVNLSRINALVEDPLQHSYQEDVEDQAGHNITDLSDRFSSWFFSLMKLYKTCQRYDGTVTDPVGIFQRDIITDRFADALQVNWYLYYKVAEIFPRFLDISDEYPIAFIPVKIEKKNDRESIYTVYLQYQRPMFGFRYSGKNNEYGIVDDYYKFSTDIDFILQKNAEHKIRDYKKANIHMQFVVDKDLKLVEILNEVSPVYSDDKTFQNW